MQNALLVTFHEYWTEYPDRKGGILFDCFRKWVSKCSGTVDHIYIMNSNNCVSNQQIKELEKVVKKVTVIDSSNSHWANMNRAFRTVKEPNLLLIDSDTIFYQPEIVDRIYNLLEEGYDIVSMLDTSGADLFNDFELFQANEKRDRRRRFTPYLFACRMDFFRRLKDFDFTPRGKWTDSMAKVTEDLMKLHPKVYELPDDRGTLYWIDGKLTASAFLDNPQFYWSASPRNKYGYYHTRNWSRGLYLVQSYRFDKKKFEAEKRIQPPSEALRLLGWIYVMSPPEYCKHVVATATSWVSAEDFTQYMKEFQEFHPWLKDLQ